eukprot:symbB.v1.2.027336.t1/scaffold2762.1/size141425/13
MGSATSVCVDLLEQMGWKDPPLANDFHHPGLVNYLSHTLLEVVLPVHAPQNDISSESKPRQYPRPTFCWEAYKMHLAMIGPSSTCKKQFLEFMPRIAHIFKGTSTKLAPGREAVPYHFFDSDLHRVVLWDLPEIQFKQKAEDYVRELGLLYIDCVFMLFSEKYVLTDIYCKLCVAMALHGIPFFVLCTQSEDGMDEKAVRRLQSSFQAQSVQVRMFNPAKPHETLEPLINDFFKEVSWNRSKGANTDRIKNASLLGQTVRVKNLEKKAELNGRCGVCIGFEKDQDRYIVRLITGGVESDIALRDQNFSILKPKLRGALVQVQGLQSKPELNGRYGFVDEFLRENERYRVFLPDKPGSALTVALKSENLEKVSATNAKPITVSAAANGTKPEASKSFAPAPRASAKAATNGASRTAVPKAEPKEAPKPAATPSKQEEKEEDFSAFLPKVGAADDEGSDDLMSRIFAAEKNEAPIPVGSQFHHGAEGRLYWPHQDVKSVTAMVRSTRKVLLVAAAAAAALCSVKMTFVPGPLGRSGAMTAGAAADYEAVNAALGRIVASVPKQTVMDVYNSMAKIVDPSVTNNMFSKVNPLDALSAAKGFYTFKDVVEAVQR